MSQCEDCLSDKAEYVKARNAVLCFPCRMKRWVSEGEQLTQVVETKAAVAEAERTETDEQWEHYAQKI